MFRRSFMVAFLLVAAAAAGLGGGQAPPPQTPPALVDINSASLEEIQSVVSDETLAKQIIEKRPYANKRQLVSRDLLSEEDYEKIKDRIVARRSNTPE